MEPVPVTCPSCFEVFSVVAPPPEELPASLDYDCEICCRPMVIHLALEGEEVTGFAEGLGE